MIGVSQQDVKPAYVLLVEPPLSSLLLFCFQQSGWATVVCGVGSLVWILYQRTQFISIGKLSLLLYLSQCLYFCAVISAS